MYRIIFPFCGQSSWHEDTTCFWDVSLKKQQINWLINITIFST